MTNDNFIKMHHLYILNAITIILQNGQFLGSNLYITYIQYKLRLRTDNMWSFKNDNYKMLHSELKANGKNFLKKYYLKTDYSSSDNPLNLSHDISNLNLNDELMGTWLITGYYLEFKKNLKEIKFYNYHVYLVKIRMMSLYR